MKSDNQLDCINLQQMSIQVKLSSKEMLNSLIDKISCYIKAHRPVFFISSLHLVKHANLNLDTLACFSVHLFAYCFQEAPSPPGLRTTNLHQLSSQRACPAIVGEDDAVWWRTDMMMIMIGLVCGLCLCNLKGCGLL